MIDERRKQLFDEQVLPHLNKAMALACWLTGNAADAEDVVQEACIRAFKVIGKDDLRNGRVWFLAVVRNAAFTWMARNRPRNLVVTDDAGLLDGASLLPNGQHATPEATLIAKADEQMVHQAMANLPIVFREALVLREFNECRYSEMAEILGVPVGTVMSRLARGRSMLMLEIQALQNGNGSTS